MGGIEVSVSAFSTELSVVRMSDLVGLSPDSQASVGDRSKSPVLMPRHNMWSVKAICEQDSELDSIVYEFFTRLQTYEEGLLRLANKSGLTFSVYGDYPAVVDDAFNLHLSSIQLNFLSRINASLDISTRPSSRPQEQ